MFERENLMNAMLSPLPETSALILAGGEGERLLPLTKSRPKPAVPFGGVFRIVDFTLANCAASNINDVAILTQYRHEVLHRYVLENWLDAWEHSGGQLRCSPPVSGKRYRGTADSVFQNLPVIQWRRPECVLILSGDHVYNMNYGDLLQRHAETGADLTIGVLEYPVEKAPHFGVVEVDHDFRVTGFAEKPESPRSMPGRPGKALISMGVYVFRTEILDEILREHCDSGFGYDFGRDIIPALIRFARVQAYDFRDEKLEPSYWRDIGTIDSYYEANMDLVGPNRAFNPYERSGVVPLCLSTNQSVLAPCVRIEAGADVQSSVLMAGVCVGKDARIRRAIVEEDVHIPSGFEIGWDIENDRKHYPVSAAGVVVVNETPRVSRPTMVFVGGRKKAAQRSTRQAAA
jgi:glucose-1-phosphate adenylyltransferase